MFAVSASGPQFEFSALTEEPGIVVHNYDAGLGSRIAEPRGLELKHFRQSR